MPKFRSKFEEWIWKCAVKYKQKLKHEPFKIPYVIPESKHKYLPDFVLPNGIIVEAKGRLDISMRRKMEAVKRCNPDLDIRIVFQKAHQPLRKGAKTTYAEWATKAGFKWAEHNIPPYWWQEKRNPDG
jgi:hypothetical protein